jgi:Undecaprenyl-phosphate galactose phosphotransferase WbaP
MPSFELATEGVSADPAPLLAALRFQRTSSLTRFAILAFSDIVAISIGAVLSYLFWARPVLSQPPEPYLRLIPLLALFPLIYTLLELYPGFGIGAVETIRRLSYGTSLGFLLLAAYTFTLKLPPVYSRVAFVGTWTLSIVLVPFIRFLVLSKLSRSSWWGEPTFIVGSRAEVGDAIRILSTSISLGYRVVGAFITDVKAALELRGVPVLGTPEAVTQFSYSGATTILVSQGSTPVSLENLQRHFRHMVVLRGDPSLPVEHVRVRHLGTTLGIEFTNQLLRRSNQIIKRALDVILGAILLTVSAPIILISGILIKLSSKGPVFFRQERAGINGYPIVLWKLRTMHRNAESILEQYLAQDQALRAEWIRKIKLSRDPRVIRGIGSLLRRLSIDELPQLLNVIRGDMSLVGPRPLPEYHLQMLSREFRQKRAVVRPGLTGMWQVMIRSDGRIDELQRYDSYYIRNWSVWLDVYIIAKTVWAVLTGHGAY